MPKGITVDDLKDQVGAPGPHPILYCAACGGEFSANKGDYFLLAGERVLKHCGKNMRLVRKKTVYEDVKP